MSSDGDPQPVIEFQLKKVLFTPEFKRNIRHLVKKYLSIKFDVQPIIDDLVQGGTPGDQIPGVKHEVFKVRVKNSDNNKGKSAGYRMIYHRTVEDSIILVTIYSKAEQADIAPDEIRQILANHELQIATIEVDQVHDEP